MKKPIKRPSTNIQIFLSAFFYLIWQWVDSKQIIARGRRDDKDGNHEPWTKDHEPQSAQMPVLGHCGAFTDIAEWSLSGEDKFTISISRFRFRSSFNFSSRYKYRFRFESRSRIKLNLKALFFFYYLKTLFFLAPN